MIPKKKEIAKNKADHICQEIREHGGEYHKRYSEIRTKPPALRVKLFGINCDFFDAVDGSGILERLEQRNIRYSFIKTNRGANAGYIPPSFVFWIPLK